MLNLKNKAFWVALLVLFFASNQVNAQKWASVYKAGYNNASIKINNFEHFVNTETTPKHGFYIGMHTEKRFLERLSFLGGFDYFHLKSHLKSKTQDFQGNISVGFLTGNVNLKFYPTYDLGIYLGGYAAMPIFTKKMNIKGSNGNVAEKINEELKKNISFDFGGRLGIDYRIFDQLHIEAFYTMGLYNYNSSSTQKVKINTFNIGLNYRTGFASN